MFPGQDDKLLLKESKDGCSSISLFMRLWIGRVQFHSHIAIFGILVFRLRWVFLLGKLLGEKKY